MPGMFGKADGGLAACYLRRPLIFAVGVLICTVLPLVSCDSRRPIYNIAHMVNSIKELNDYLDRGANAIELDITFYKNGTVNNVYHGYPCDCYRICDDRENLDKYLNYVRELVDPKGRNFQKQLTMLLFDLKLEEVSRSQKFRAGEEIAKYLITHLWSKDDRSAPRIGVLISIGHTSDSDVIRGFQDTLRKTHRRKYLNKIGFDVGLNDDLKSIQRMWSKLDVISNRWQGDGITNCLRPFKDQSRLKQAVQYRDSPNEASVEKVYDWTVDLTANMRQSLRLGVDAMLTNFPERLHSVLQEPEFQSRYRLATQDDDPFTRVSIAPTKTNMKKMDLDAYVGSIREVTVALMGYFWDFYRLRLQNPSTLFPMIQQMLVRNMPTILEYIAALQQLSKKGLLG